MVAKIVRRTKKTDAFVVGNDGVAAATADLFRSVSRYPPMVLLRTVVCCCLGSNNTNSKRKHNTRHTHTNNYTSHRRSYRLQQ